MSGTSPRALAGRIGGYARAKRIDDMQAAMTPAWKGQIARYEREVDPDGTLPAEERTRRAKAAQREHMARLALRSHTCLLYTSPSPRDRTRSRMPSSA